MKKFNLFLLNIIFLVILFVTFTKDVHAYIDPGTGSFAFQVILGSILGAVFVSRNLLKKLFFRKKKDNEEKDN